MFNALVLDLAYKYQVISPGTRGCWGIKRGKGEEGRRGGGEEGRRGGGGGGGEKGRRVKGGDGEGIWGGAQSTYICRVQSCVWRLPTY
jgi:hypothetical protein